MALNSYLVPSRFVSELRKGSRIRYLILPTGPGGQSHRLTNAVVKDWHVSGRAVEVHIEFSKGEKGLAGPAGFLSGGILSNLSPAPLPKPGTAPWPTMTVFCESDCSVTSCHGASMIGCQPGKTG